MAISEKVIDLAPVNKTKNIILYVLIGVLAALAVTFVVLFIIKKPYEEPKVNSIQKSADTLNVVRGDDGSEALYASAGNEYVVYAEVGAEVGADTQVEWRCTPANAVVKIEAGQDPEKPGRYFYKFRASEKADPSLPITLSAVSVTNPEVHYDTVFYVKEQNTATMEFVSLLSPNKVSIDLSQAVKIPYFFQSSNNKEYLLKVAQFGAYDEVRQDHVPLTDVAGTEEGKKTVSLDVEVTSDPEGVLANVRLLSAESDTVSFKAAKPGKATISVIANRFNGSEEVVKTLEVEVAHSATLNYITSIALPRRTVYVGDNVDDVASKIKIEPASFQDEEGEWMKKLVFESKTPDLVDFYYREGKIWLIPKKPGRATVRISDPTPDGLQTSVETTVDVFSPVSTVTPYYMENGKKVPITADSSIPAARGEDVEVYFDYAVSSSDANANYLNNYLEVDVTKDVLKSVTLINSVTKKPYPLKGDGTDEPILLSLTVNEKTATGMIVFRFAADASTSALPVTLFKNSGSKSDAAATLPLKFKVNLKATSFSFKSEEEVNALFAAGGDNYSSFQRGQSRSTIRYQMSNSDSVVAIEDLFDVLEPGAAATFRFSTPSYYGKDGGQNIYFRDRAISADGKTHFFMHGLKETDGPKDNKGAVYYIEFNVSVDEIPNFSLKLRIELTDTIVDIRASETPVRETYYNAALGSGKFDLGAEKIVVRYLYQTSEPEYSDYDVSLRIGDITLDKKENTTEATFEYDGIELFAFNKGEKSLTARADLYGLSIEKGVKLDSVQVEFSTNGCAKSYTYTFIRLVDSVRIFADEECTTELTTSDTDRLILNRNTEHKVYPSGIVKYTTLAGQEVEYIVKKTKGNHNLNADTLVSSAADANVTVTNDDPCTFTTRDLEPNQQEKAEVRIKPAHGKDQTYFEAVYISVQYLSRPIEKIEILGPDGQPVSAFTLATDKDFSNEVALTVKVTYDSLTPEGMSYTMLDEVNFKSNKGYFRLGETTFAPAIVEGKFIYTYSLVVGLHGAGGKQSNGEDVITASSGMVGDASATVTGRIYTPVTGATLTGGGVTYTAGETNAPLALAIDKDNATDPRVFTLNLTAASAFGLDYDDIEIKVLQKEGGAAANFVTAVWDKTSAPYKLTLTAIARADNGHLIVEVYDKSADPDHPAVFTIDIPVTVSVATHSLDLSRDGQPIAGPVSVVTTGGEGTKDIAIGIVKNGGDTNLIPNVDASATLHITDKNGNFLTSPDVSIVGGKLSVRQSVLNNKQLHGSESVYKFYVTALTAGGVKSPSYPIDVATTALGLRFSNPALAGQEIHDITLSDGNKFVAEVYNRGSGIRVANPSGTISYAITAGGEYAAINPANGELSFTATAAEGTITVTVSYAAGADGIGADPLSGTVKFYNNAKSVAFSSGLGHYAAGTLTMLKGDRVKLTDYLEFTGHRAGDAYYSAISLTLPTGLSATGAGKEWTLTAAQAGTYQATLTVSVAGGETLTLDFTVVVIQPMPSLGEDATLDVRSSALTLSVPLTEPALDGYTGSWTVTAPENQNFLTVSGHTVTLDPTKLTKNSDYGVAYPFAVRYTVAGFDGFTYVVDKVYRVTVTTDFALDFGVYEAGEQKSGNLSIADKTYTLDSDDVLFGDAQKADITYAVKEGAFLSIGTNNALSFTGVGTAKISASVTVYGYTYVTEKEFTFVDETNLTLSMTGAEGTGPDYTLAADYAGTAPKKFKVVIGYAQVGLTPTIASTRIIVSGPEGAVTPVGALVMDEANKTFYQEYAATGLGKVTFDAVIVVGSTSYGTTRTVSVTLGATAPSFTLSAGTLSLNQATLSGSVTAAKAGGAFDAFTVQSKQVTESRYNNQADAGKALVTLSHSGAAITARATEGTFGGKVKVVVTLVVSDGLYAGKTFDVSFEVVVNAPARPTLTTADYAGFLSPGGKAVLGSETYRKVDGAAGNSVSYTYAYEGPASFGTLTGGEFTANSALTSGGVAELSVTAKMTSGWWKDLTLTGKITVRIAPAISFKDDMKTWLTAGGSATATGGLDLSDATVSPTLASGTGIVTYELIAGDAAYISGTRLVSHMKGGSVTVRATFTVTSGPLTGATAQAESKAVEVLTVSAGTTSLTPGNTYAPGAGGLNLTPAPSGMTTAFEFFGKTQLSFANDTLAVAQDANFTGANYTLPVGVTMTAADGKVYYNEIDFTIQYIAAPSVTAQGSLNGNDLTGDNTEIIYAGDTVTFTPDAGIYQADITSVYLTLNDTSYGAVSASGTQAAFTAAEVAADNAEVEITLHAVIFGQDYASEVFKVKIGKQTSGVFKAEANKSTVVRGESIEYTVSPKSGSLNINYVYVYHYADSQNSSNIASWTLTAYKGQNVTSGKRYDYGYYTYYRFESAADRYILAITTAAGAAESFDLKLSTGYGSGYYGSNSSTNTITVRTVGAVTDDVLSLTSSAAAAYVGQPVQLYASLAPGYVGGAVSYSVPAGLSESGGKLTASAEGIYTVTASCTVAGKTVTKNITVAFVARRTLLTTADGSDYTTLFKGQAYALSLSTPLPAAFDATVVYKSGNAQISSPYTPATSGTETLSAAFTVNGQEFVISKSVTVVDKPSISVTTEGNVFIIEQRENALYNAQIVSGADYGAIAVSGNRVTFTPKTDTAGGQVVIEFSITFNGGIFDGITVTTTETVTVSPAAQPEISLASDTADGTVTASATGSVSVKITDYKANAADAGYFRTFGISDGKLVYTLNPSAAGRALGLTVTVTYQSGVYAGVSVEKQISVTAPAVPAVTVNPNLSFTVANGSVTGYTAAAGGEYIRALTYAGDQIAYTLKSSGAGQTVTVKLTAQSGAAVYAGLTFESGAVTLSAPALPGFTFAADNTTVTPKNAAEFDGVTYFVTSGAECLLGGIAADGTYVPKALTSPGYVKVLVSGRIKTGVYAGETVSAERTITVAAVSFTLGADSEAGTITTDKGAIVGYEMRSGAAYVETATISGGKILFTLKSSAAGQTIKFAVTVRFTDGDYNGQTAEGSVEFTGPAAPSLTVNADLTYVAGAGTEITGYEVTAGGAYVDSLTYAASPVAYTLRLGAEGKTVTAKLTLASTYAVYGGLTAGSNLFTLPTPAEPSFTFTEGKLLPNESDLGATYTIVSGDAYITVDAAKDSYTLVPGATDGTVVIRYTAVIPSGLYKGQTLTRERTIAVPAAALPEISLTQDDGAGKVTASSLAGGRIVGYAIAGGDKALFRSAGVTDGAFVYTLDKSTAGRAIAMTVEVAYTSGVYAGRTVTKDLSLAAPAAPTVTVNPNLSFTVTGGSVTGYVATAGGEYLRTLAYAGSIDYTLKTGAAGKAVKIKLGLTSAAAVYAGEVWESDEIVLTASAPAGPALQFAGEGTLAPSNAADFTDISFTVVSGGEYLDGGIGADGSYTAKTDLTAPGTVVVLVTATAGSGVYAGETVTAYRTVTIPAAQKPVLTLNSATAGEIVPSLDAGSFEIVSATTADLGALTSLTAAGGKVLYTLDPTYTGTAVVTVSVRVTSGAYTGEILSENYSISANAATFVKPAEAQNGVISPIEGLTATYAYASDAAISVNSAGRVVSRGAAAGTYPVTVTATVTEGVYAGAVISYEVDVTVDSMATVTQDPGFTGNVAGGTLTYLIDGNTVTVGGTGETVAWYPADDALGRPVGNRFGLQFKAPAGLIVDRAACYLSVVKDGGEPQVFTTDFFDGDDYFWLYPGLSGADGEALASRDVVFTVTVGFNGTTALQEFTVVVKAGTLLEAAPAAVAA